MPPKRSNAKGDDGLTDKQAYLRAESQRIEDDDGVDAAEAKRRAERAWNALAVAAKVTAAADKRVWWAARGAPAAAPAAGGGAAGREEDLVNVPGRDVDGEVGRARRKSPARDKFAKPVAPGEVIEPENDQVTAISGGKRKGKAALPAPKSTNSAPASQTPAAPSAPMAPPRARRHVPERSLVTGDVKTGRKRKAEGDLPRWPNEEYWTGAGEYLGGGAFGQAYLFVAVDPLTERITRRMVVKDCYVNRIHWGHVQHWYGDPSNPLKRKHMEIKAMENIWGLPGSDKCVELHHSEAGADGMFYRIYMNYCRHGKLQMLIEPSDDY
ncbi:hypothetical protein LTR85_005514 [Meristemomyces frigidus]|nr:hypothetical protein LTR85_005514 [Meristemomyces frigidus]